MKQVGSANPFVQFGAVLGLLCVPLFHVAAEIIADPEVIVFHTTTQSETVRLRLGDQALPGTALTGWRLLVDERNYSHMLRVTPQPDGVRIMPSDTVEIGSYLLALETSHGTARVQVFTPLSEQESIIESLARRMGVGRDDVRKQMGISRRFAREQLTLSLEPVHYWGQRIVIEMPASETEGRRTRWKANGDVILEGTDQRRLEYVLAETGPLLLAYEEWENNTQVAGASALTEVVKHPALRHEVRRNAEASFRASEGFARHTWRLDGQPAGHDAVWVHRFQTPGEYVVAVLSEDPVAPGPYAMREDIYHVVVTDP